MFVCRDASAKSRSSSVSVHKKKTTIFQTLLLHMDVATQGRVSTEYITLWHTNGCYVRAGAGTSHGYRDEVLTAIFNSSFLMHPLYPHFFFSLFSRFFAGLLTPRRKAPSTNPKIHVTPRVAYFRLF